MFPSHQHKTLSCCQMAQVAVQKIRLVHAESSRFCLTFTEDTVHNIIKVSRRQAALAKPKTCSLVAVVMALHITPLVSPVFHPRLLFLSLTAMKSCTDLLQLVYSLCLGDVLACLFICTLYLSCRARSSSVETSMC